MKRKSIDINVARRLWAGCGGFCQNPACNRPLFASVGSDLVSLANVAHIIGYGSTGPRSEHELAECIDKDGIANLIMLCLDCHKIVDELDEKYTVEQMCRWKADHEQKVQSLFSIPTIRNEHELLAEINDLLETNGCLFEEYGPFSTRALADVSGDVSVVWRRRCLDTILPNNQRIVNLIEKNKRYLPYPWEGYRLAMGFKLHAEAFRDNCLLGQKVNDYKLFPQEFAHFVKRKLGIDVPPLERRPDEELEFRWNQVSLYVERYLAEHSFIERVDQLDVTSMIVSLADGRSLRVFVTNTYYFTEYTFEKVMAMNPEVDAIIASCPSGTYSEAAKRLCIESGIGLFSLREFMGAVRKRDDEFLNYLSKADRESRIERFRKRLRSESLPRGLRIYLFGSFLRGQLYRDIDVLVVYSDDEAKAAVRRLEELLNSPPDGERAPLDFTVCTSGEFAMLKLDRDNLTLLHAS